MQLVINVKEGATAKDIATQLRWQANLIEGMEPKKAASTEATSATATKSPATKKAAAPAAPAPAVVEEDDDFKADADEASGFDDDDNDTVAEASFDDAAPEEVEEKKPAKTAANGSNGKAKKVTLDDVNDACKAHAQAKGRPATLAILQKKFKTQSVTALKPEQYEMAIAAMSVN